MDYKGGFCQEVVSAEFLEKKINRKEFFK
jgi:hypothetical protein